MTKILLVSYAYNEQNNLESVIKKVKKTQKKLKKFETEFLVINDGSTDRTQELLDDIKIKTISHPFNLGPGVTLRTAYMYAVKNDFDYVVRFDSDGQHNPEYIPELLAPLFNKEADLVIGSRYVNDQEYKTSFVREIGIVFFSKIVSFLGGKKIADVTSGFRAVKGDLLKEIIYHIPRDFTALQLTLLESRMGIKIKEVPIEMNQRLNGKSYLNKKRLCKYPFKMFLAVLRGLK